jgi:hypothetical protein
VEQVATGGQCDLQETCRVAEVVAGGVKGCLLDLSAQLQVPACQLLTLVTARWVKTP